MSDTGCYAYAIARGLREEDLADHRGIGAGPLRVVRHGTLAAVVSEVDLGEFGEEGLRRNLEELAWLEQVAVAHDDVVRAVAGLVPTAPLRLATVFFDDDSVRARLEELSDLAHQALDRVEGRAEWSVKAYADRSRPPAAEPASGGPVGGGPGTGRAYLAQRRAVTRQRQTSAEEDAATARELHAALESCTDAGRRLPPQDRRLSRHAGEMILNGTYLVVESRAGEFRREVDRLAGLHPHLRLEVGGPWPPYSFAVLDTP